MIDIRTIETKDLGDRSYLVHDGAVAAVIDPQRDIDRVLRTAEEAGVRITHVFETHLHNDYVTGGVELAHRTGARYVMPDGEPVQVETYRVRDGDVIEVGSMAFRALHTPGHTEHHMAYAVSAGDDAVAVFTGGSMLFGAAGRTDLVAEDQTVELTRQQHRSIRRLAAELPDGTQVLPTHGFGSFCSAMATSGDDASTIGKERGQNPALVREEDDFVETLLAGLAAHPSYYVHMAPINAHGPAPVDLSPVTEVDGAELRRRIDAGEWVVDLRARRAFAHRHRAGTFSTELSESFATFLGWAIPWGTPVTLLGESHEDVAAAQRQLVRIGIDRPAGAAVGPPESFSRGDDLGTYRVATFADLASARGEDSAGVCVLDVRRPDEFDESHIAGAVNIAFSELPLRTGEVPAGPEVWVQRASGARASMAASFLAAAGRTVVLIDDEFDKAADQGVPVVSG